MRETIPRSDETFLVLSGHEAEFATEADKDVSYFNKVKNGVEADRFAQFRALFRVGCRTTAPVEIWLNDLQGIFARSRRTPAPVAELSDKLLEKIPSDSDLLQEILTALQDKKLDKSECHLILAKLEKNKAIIKQIEELVQTELGELDAECQRKLRAI